MRRCPACQAPLADPDWENVWRLRLVDMEARLMAVRDEADRLTVVNEELRRNAA